MESLLNQALNIVVTDQKCTICNVVFANDSAKFSHCISQRHLANIKNYREQIKRTLEGLQTVEVPKVGINPLMPFFKCEMCNISVVSEEKLARHWSSHHNRIYPFYCPTCRVSTNSAESMFEHYKTEGHQLKPEGQYTPFGGKLPTELINLMRISGCNVCNKIFSQPILENALQHYKAEYHQSAVCHWFNERRRFSNSDPRTGPLVSYPLQSLENTARSNFQTTIFCYVCKKKVLRTEKNTHTQTFPHTEFAKIKLMLVKKGVAEVFWHRYQEGFFCKLCNAKLTGFSQFEGHFRSSFHKAQYQEWLQNALLSKFQPDFRDKTSWFYCQICDKDLDGTSDAANHYTGTVHQKYATMYCEICVKRFVSVGQLKQHKQSEHHRPSKVFVNNTAALAVPEKRRQSSSNSVTSESSVQSSLLSENAVGAVQIVETTPHPVNVQNSSEESNQEPDDENKNLKEQVFNELQKLVQKLYYSKTVPYEYGLDYLKKINKEVEQVSATFKPKKIDKDIEQLSTTFKPNSTETEIAGSNVLVKDEAEITVTATNCSEVAEKDSHKSVVMKNTADALPLTSVVNGLSELTINDSKKDSDVPLEEVLALPALTNIEDKSRKWFPNVLNVSGINEHNELGSSETETLLKPPQLTEATKNIETISDLLSDILERKQELESEHQNAPKVYMEKDILNEIEILLRRIERNDAPLCEILHVLESHNEQLDKEEVIKKCSKFTKKCETVLDLLSVILERKQELESDHQNAPNIRLEKDILNEIEILLRRIERGDAPLYEILHILESYNEQLDKEETKNIETISDLLPDNLVRKEELESKNQNAPKLQLEKDILNEIEILLRRIEQSDVPLLYEILHVLKSYNEQLDKKEFTKKYNKLLSERPVQNGASIDIGLEGSNATCDAGSVKADNNVQLKNDQENEPSDKEADLKSIGLTSSFDLANAHDIERLSPEPSDTSVETLHRIDLCPSLSNDTSSDYISAEEEENSKESDISKKEIIDIQVTEKTDQNNVKYSYTVEELTHLRSFSKLDSQVKSQIDRHKLWHENPFGSPHDVQNTMYTYYSGNNLNLFMNFLDVYLQGPASGICDQLQ